MRWSQWTCWAPQAIQPEMNPTCLLLYHISLLTHLPEASTAPTCLFIISNNRTGDDSRWCEDDLQFQALWPTVVSLNAWPARYPFVGWFLVGEWLYVVKPVGHGIRGIDKQPGVVGPRTSRGAVVWDISLNEAITTFKSQKWSEFNYRNPLTVKAPERCTLGLVKLMAVGLNFGVAIFSPGIREWIPPWPNMSLDCRILWGPWVVKNSYDETGAIGLEIGSKATVLARPKHDELHSSTKKNNCI